MTLIDVGQIIDLACGTPETGVINFNALHTLLHIFLQQLNMQSVRLELGEGFASLGTQAAAAPARQHVDIAAYAVQPDDDGSMTHRELLERASSVEEQPVINTVLVVRRHDDGGGMGGARAGARQRPVQQQQPSHPAPQHPQHQQHDRQQQPQQQPPAPFPSSATASVSSDDYPQRPIVVPAQADFRDMQSDVHTIQDRVGGILPDSRELIETLGQPQSAVNDMWDMLNVTKRLDAAEITIQKLIAMLNDMGKEYTRISSQLEVSQRGEDITNIKDQLDTIEQRIHSVGSLHSLHAQPAALVTLHAPAAEREAADVVAAAEPSSRYLMPTARVSPAELADFDREEFVQLKSDLDYIKMAVQRIALCSGQKDIAAYLTKDMTQVRCPVTTDEIGGGIDAHNDGNDTGGDTSRNEEMANRLRALDKRTETLERRMVTADKRLYDVEKDFGETGERIEDVIKQMEAKAAQDHDTAALYAQMNDMKAKTMQNFQSIGMLLVARDTLTTITEDLMARVARVDQTKIDREEADELLAEKADYNMVQRKVSNDHFDAAKRELGTGLGEALAQIVELEERFQTELATMRGLLEERTSQADLDRLRELLFGKLTTMQDRMRALSVAKREPEAAGTRTKFLRDVQCLSCEQKVVMRREEGATVGRAEPLGAFKSMKPQLTFELDAVRREMRQGGNSRNMHHFEKMYKGVAGGASCVDKAHLCARYCGGSHTAIAAHESVAKRNLPRQKDTPRQADNLMKGVDGAFYRGAPFEECNCAEGPAPPLPVGMTQQQPKPTAMPQPQQPQHAQPQPQPQPQPQQPLTTPSIPQQPPPTVVMSKKEPTIAVTSAVSLLAVAGGGSAKASTTGSLLNTSSGLMANVGRGASLEMDVNSLDNDAHTIETIADMAPISRIISVEEATVVEGGNVNEEGAEISQQLNLETAE